MEPEKAQADFLDLKAKYSGKKVKALEFEKRQMKQIDMFSDKEYDDNWGVELVDDLHSENLKTLARFSKYNENCTKKGL